MMKTRVPALACALFLTLGLTPPVWAAAPSFSDVRPEDWFFPYVVELAQAGGVSGYPDGTFRPGDPITRIETAAMALRAFPSLGSPQDASLPARLEAQNPGYWGNDIIYRGTAAGYDKVFGTSRAQWDKPAARDEMAYLMVQALLSSTSEKFTVHQQAASLIADYESQVSHSAFEAYIRFLYSCGVSSGDENGNFNPRLPCSRAEASTLLTTLSHRERWKQIDWEAAGGRREAVRLEDGTDFTGMARIRYDLDTAYDYCRALEEQIGIQIFYLPEWTEKSAGILHYSDFSGIPLDASYFRLVLEELKKMKAAYDLYPEGFLKEVVQKKAPRRVEIILCPYTYAGTASYGLHLYDHSSGAKTDQIYYTGAGDSQYYSHEMGHMVLTSAALLSGWDAVCAGWDALSASSADYISAYAMSSRAEDWAETWAFLWHQPGAVAERIRAGSAGLRGKAEMTARLLTENYASAGELPWLSILD